MGSICSGARSDDVPEKTSIALDRKYKNVNLQDILGDICNQSAEAIVPPAAIVTTSAGTLHAKYIIHFVSPLWTGGDHDEEDSLSQGVLNVLSKADEMGISSLAFPDISGGIFGFPKELAAEVLIRTVFEYINKHPATNLRMIKFVAIENTMVKLIKTEIQKWGVLDSLPTFKSNKPVASAHLEEEEEEQNEVAPLFFNPKRSYRSPLRTPSFGSRAAESTSDQFIEEKLRLNNTRQL